MNVSYRLNGGSVRNYVPIGEDGRPVWKNAGAFRQAVLQNPSLGPEYAKMLAEPEFSNGGEHVDWFVRFQPKNPSGYEVIRWDAASPEERRAAWAQLSRFESRLDTFGRDLERRALTPDSTVFAHYLTGTSSTETLPAVHFPSPDCVYIVDGIPVITFWGYLAPGQSLADSPFSALKSKDAGKAAEAAPAGAAAAAAPATGSWLSRHWKCLLLLPLLLLLLLLLLYLLWWYFFAKPLGLGLGALPDLGNLSLNPPALERSAADLGLADPKDPGAALPDGRAVAGRDGTVFHNNGTAVRDGVVPASGSEAESEEEIPAIPASDDDDVVPVTDNDDVVPVTDDDDIVPVTDDDDVVPAGSAAEDEIPGIPETDEDGVAPANPASVPAKDDAAADQGKDDAAAKDDAADNSKDDAAKDQGKDDAADSAKNDPGAKDGGKECPPGEDPNAKDRNTAENGNLVLDPKDLKSGSVRGIDGTWNTSSGIFDSRTNKPLSIKYSFKDGKGQAVVTRSDGVTCTVPASGSAASGALEISGGTAVCADGGKVELPVIRCKPGKNGKADCSGVYGQGENLRLELYR